ncbi:hypothetical protein WJ0W_002369 [Paenibacillus melissococcoides]|uniref:AP2-like integrase N-terminal domain-containing protein n=1 Tax=Paenibacillus melissococcoides TaxID=2912268 RepID=A0ABN8U2B1_9BACL|nr:MULTISPECIES: hypothetical protein [Paenibacillus]GIO82861.1 hypothetical protein J6TS7_64710 [Paenibacillus dendritiformis]CAH8245139.1 hypothetical protein WJ0W_002369 [Paenibacillus melissococcoides]CAH8710085.1 hypothetical protein WDD9_002451 [Paenibacillus melissococcoides]CAH8710854.1 hypothetical protein HTL2_002751 [Paenibacillus melissococcoides]
MEIPRIKRRGDRWYFDYNIGEGKNRRVRRESFLSEEKAREAAREVAERRVKEQLKMLEEYEQMARVEWRKEQ